MILKKQNSSIALLSLTGNITETVAINFLLKLRSLPSHKSSVSALILRVSSNGGSLGAAQTIVEGLELLRSELNIPIISLVTDTALSAAFYVAISADQCIATPASMLGNIGCIVRKFSLSSLFENIGIKYESIASGANKDILFNVSSFNQEQKALLETLSKDSLMQFLSHIDEKRDVKESVLRYLEDGKIFSGRKACEVGLIDTNGGLFTAIQYCGEIINERKPQIIVLDLKENNTNLSRMQFLLAGFQSLFSR
ncbi:S49 family peptidase [Microbulbifer sp. TRSA007]|uniref:S49 family peptidase n=1 Tax=Microbulbifer sp. TRSA007 TaxID=3243384 RepID=UPI00403A0ED8